jgi:hypothetical protein
MRPLGPPGAQQERLPSVRAYPAREQAIRRTLREKTKDCASSKETTDLRFPRDGKARRNRCAIRAARFDAIADSLSRSAAARNLFTLKLPRVALRSRARSSPVLMSKHRSNNCNSAEGLADGLSRRLRCLTAPSRPTREDIPPKVCDGRWNVALESHSSVVSRLLAGSCEDRGPS